VIGLVLLLAGRRTLTAGTAASDDEREESAQ
jgi:hypothetical protein